MGNSWGNSCSFSCTPCTCVNASNYYSLDDKTCYQITPMEQFITSLFVLTLSCLALVVWDVGTWIWNKNNSKKQRSPFGDATTGVRIAVITVSIIIGLIVVIMAWLEREDVGEGKLVFKPSETSLYCTEYDNVSSDTQGFFTASGWLSLINTIVMFVLLFENEG